jgi:signal transduction histidine kinase
VVLSLKKARGHLHLVVEDDGKGFHKKKKSAKGLGLHIMDYRASVLAGTFAIESNSNGTRILCTIPLKSRPEKK